MTDFTPLTEMSAEIRKRTGQQGPGYRKLHILACDGRIPARKEGRAWVVDRADVPAVIAALGLSPARQPA